MAIQSIEESKILKQYGKMLGREKIAERIVEICTQVATNGTYIDSIKAAGKIRALAMACRYDGYWDEKMHDGYYNEIQKARTALYNVKKEEVK